MAGRPKSQRPEIPKDVARGVADKASFDRLKSKRTSRDANLAADRLLKEMDEVLKRLER